MSFMDFGFIFEKTKFVWHSGISKEILFKFLNSNIASKRIFLFLSGLSFEFVIDTPLPIFWAFFMELYVKDFANLQAS